MSPKIWGHKTILFCSELMEPPIKEVFFLFMYKKPRYQLLYKKKHDFKKEKDVGMSKIISKLKRRFFRMLIYVTGSIFVF